MRPRKSTRGALLRWLRRRPRHQLRAMRPVAATRGALLRRVRHSGRERVRACGAGRARPHAARLHTAPPGRQDPAIAVGAAGRAKTSHRDVRRRAGLDGARRRAWSGSLASHPRSLLRDPQRGRSPLRGDRQSVHRRRDHGSLWRADRPRGPRPASLFLGAAPARQAARLRGRAEANQGCVPLDSHRSELR